MSRTSALCLSALLAAGCGGSAATRHLSNTVDRDLLRVFPPEGRRYTYEAENEVIIALDRLDAARDQRLALEAKLEATDESIATAEKRGGAGVEVPKAWRSYLESRRDQAKAEVRAAEQAVFCARTSLELTKARLVVKFDLPVAGGYVKAFEGQYESCATTLDEAKKEAERLAQEALKARDGWRKTRADFVQKTGDHNHGLWID
jgi:hypothetical protein